MKHNNKNVMAFFDPCNINARQRWKHNFRSKNDCQFHPLTITTTSTGSVFVRSRVPESTLYLSLDEIMNSNPSLPFDSAQSLISSSDMSSLGPLGATAFCIVMIGLLGLSQLMTKPLSLNENVNMSETADVDDHEIASAMLQEEMDVKDETMIVPKKSSIEPIVITDVGEEMKEKVSQEGVVFVEDELELESKKDNQLKSTTVTESTEEVLDTNSNVDLETEPSLELLNDVDVDVNVDIEEIVNEPEMVMDIPQKETNTNEIDKTKNSIFSKAFARKKTDEPQEMEAASVKKDPFDDNLRYEMEKLQAEAILKENETKQKQQAKEQKLREDVESLKMFLRQQESEGVLLPQNDENEENEENEEADLKPKGKASSLLDNDPMAKESKQLSKILQPTINEVVVPDLQLNKDVKKKRNIEIFKNKKSILLAAFLIVIGKRLLSLLITKSLR